MNLIFIFGPCAVGKMTVAQSISSLTGYRVFHNHMTIDPVNEILGEINWNIVQKWREALFEECAKREDGGLLFTYCFAFDRQSEWNYVNHVTEIFKNEGGSVYYIELFSPQEVRLERNKTENRLKHKPSKRNIAESDENLKSYDIKYRCNSYDGEITFENYIKIDNTSLSPDQTAEIALKHFKLIKI